MPASQRRSGNREIDTGCWVFCLGNNNIAAPACFQRLPTGTGNCESLSVVPEFGWDEAFPVQLFVRSRL